MLCTGMQEKISSVVSGILAAGPAGQLLNAHVPTGEAEVRISVDVHKTLCRSPLGHKRLYDLGRCMAAENDLVAAVAVGDVGDVGDISLTFQHSSLGQLRDVSVATQICHIDTVGKTLIGSVDQ